MVYLIGAVLAIGAGFWLRRCLRAEGFPNGQEWERFSWLLIRGGNLAILLAVCLGYSSPDEGIGLVIFLSLAVVSLFLRKHPVILTVMTPVVFTVLIAASVRGGVSVPDKPADAVWKPRTALGRSIHAEYSPDLLDIAREFSSPTGGLGLRIIDLSSSFPKKQPDERQWYFEFYTEKAYDARETSFRERATEVVTGDIYGVAKTIAAHPHLLESRLHHEVVLCFEWRVAWYVTPDIPVNTQVEWIEVTIPTGVLTEFAEGKLSYTQLMQRSTQESAKGPVRL